MVFAFAGDSTMTSGLGTGTPGGRVVGLVVGLWVGRRGSDRSLTFLSVVPRGGTRCQTVVRWPRSVEEYAARPMLHLLAVNWLDPKSLVQDLGTPVLLLLIFLESGIFPAPLPGDSL